MISYSSKITDYLRIIIGALFIFSGITKAIDTSYFAGILSAYGNVNLGFLAPLIIILELMSGICLLFNILIKIVCIIDFLTVVIFTIVYSYGLLVMGIQECGCFGHIGLLNSPPWILYIRNIIILIIIFYVYKSSDCNKFVSAKLFSVSILFIAALSFVCGKTFKWKGNVYNDILKEATINLQEHPLGTIIDLPSDSLYMIAVFSYSCPHCINSFGNLIQYDKLGIVDRIIGIAVEDSIQQERFTRIFNPEFEIHNYPLQKVMDVSKDLPFFFFVRNDSIIHTIKGEIPSAYFLIPHDNTQK